jgi:hypothetical protein
MTDFVDLKSANYPTYKAEAKVPTEIKKRPYSLLHWNWLKISSSRAINEE